MIDDPFAFEDDDDRTVLRPVEPLAPRGRNRQGVSAPRDDPSELPKLGGINRLERAASRLLPLLVTLRHSREHPDPGRLRNDLIRELESFKGEARTLLDDPRQVTQASYVLCTALDEAAMNTPWGHRVNWSQHNLLNTFHNEVAGGERFFTLLKGLARKPAENLAILELMYVCLSLGYEGAYRITKDGQDTLVKIRRWLYGILEAERGRPQAQLADHWAGSGVGRRRLPRSMSLWILAAAAVAIATLVWLGLRVSLSERADRTIAGFWTAEAEPFEVRTVAPPIAPRPSVTAAEPLTLTLSDRLAGPIAAGRVSVDENHDRGEVRLLGDTLFASGRFDLETAVAPLLVEIGDALDAYEGDVHVVGHSDNVPIRGGRYASNLELSRARADAVARVLSSRLDTPERIRVDGRGSLEPIASNDNPDGRARNRRVEITLYY